MLEGVTSLSLPTETCPILLFRIHAGLYQNPKAHALYPDLVYPLTSLIYGVFCSLFFLKKIVFVQIN